jgi:uncharacterized membrane protein YqaE (UPF0057 family)
MLIILAFFLPPLALLLAGMPFQALINLVLCILSIIGFVFLWPGVVMSVVAVAHAILMIHNQRADRRAQRIIDAIERN